jgi:hypothetical protein
MVIGFCVHSTVTAVNWSRLQRPVCSRIAQGNRHSEQPVCRKRAKRRGMSLLLLLYHRCGWRARRSDRHRRSRQLRLHC